MQNQFSRTELLLGRQALDTLRNARVAVFGAGGVGGYAIEVLARSGVGAIDVIDDDRVCLSNVNRQIIATTSAVGKFKTDIAGQRILDINPECIVRKHRVFYLPDKAEMFEFDKYDYVIDCVDTVTAKLDIVRRCKKTGVPVISCMGAAYKLDATQLRVTDLYKTINDPLSKVMRKKLRKDGIMSLKVVFSPEMPLENIVSDDYAVENQEKEQGGMSNKRTTPGSNAWVPAAAGLLAGSEVVKDLINAAGTMRVMPDDLTKE